MSIRSATTDSKVHISSSKFLLTLTLISYGTGILSLLILAMDHLLAWIGLPFVIIFATKNIRRDCLRLSPCAIVLCQQIGPRLWRLRNRADETMIVHQTAKAFRSPWFVTIQFKRSMTKQKMTAIFAFDAMDKQNYRKLLTMLWEGYRDDDKVKESW